VRNIGAGRERSTKLSNVQSMIYDYLQSAYISQAKNRNSFRGMKKARKLDIFLFWKKS
jgi:hypothetical protein